MLESRKKEPADGNWRSDYVPSFFPPFLVKELRKGVRTRSFALIAGFLPLLMLVPYVFVYYRDTDVLLFFLRSDANLLLWFSYFLVFFFILPLKALFFGTYEEAGRDDLLALTRLSAGRMVFQKWLAIMAQSLLLVIIMAPFFIARFCFIQVDFQTDLMLLVDLMLCSFVLTAISIWVCELRRFFKVIWSIVLASAFLLKSVAFFPWLVDVPIIKNMGERFSPDLEQRYSMLAGWLGKLPFFDLWPGQEGLYGQVNFFLISLFALAGFLMLAAREKVPHAVSMARLFRVLVLVGIPVFAGLSMWGVFAADGEFWRSRFLSAFTVLCLLDILMDSRQEKGLQGVSSRQQPMGRRMLSWVIAPGWPGSVLIYLAGIWLIGCGGCIVSGEDLPQVSLYVLLYGCSALFPALLVGMFVKFRTPYILLYYLLCLALFGVGSMTLIRLEMQGVAAFLPIGSALMSDVDGLGVQVGQVVLVAGTCVLYLFRSRVYWKDWLVSVKGNGREGEHGVR